MSMLAASGSPVAAQSLEAVHLIEDQLERKSGWFFGASALQHYRIENLTDRTLRVDVECGFETATGYADGGGDVHIIPPRRMIKGSVGGDSPSGKAIERANCTVASVTPL